MGFGLVYRGTHEAQDKSAVFQECIKAEVPHLSLPLLTDTGLVNCAFSTRLGGVSTGMFQSMNISNARGDDPLLVQENLRRMAEVMEVPTHKMVFGKQLHTDHVAVIGEKEVTEGIAPDALEAGIDGMVTNLPEVCLVTGYADCVPLFFLDPKKRVIGLTHSGWRGTVRRIGKRTVEMMCRTYGCLASDILAAVGPSICMDCYEVSEDVISEFRAQGFSSTVYRQTGAQHYQLNLWEANREILLEAGILESHLAVTDLCTACNDTLLFSHRKSKGKRGNMGAFLVIKENRT